MRLLTSITLLIAIISGFSHAGIYRWVDANGQVHYSDEPRPGARRVQLDTDQGKTVQFNRPTINQSRAASDASLPDYQVAIIQPIQHETIRNDDGHFSIELSLAPKLDRFHRVQLLMNGNEIAAFQENDIMVLHMDGVERGEHQLVARVMDQTGKVIAQTDTLTLYLHRHTSLGATRLCEQLVEVGMVERVGGKKGLTELNSLGSQGSFNTIDRLSLLDKRTLLKRLNSLNELYRTSIQPPSAASGACSQQYNDIRILAVTDQDTFYLHRQTTPVPNKLCPPIEGIEELLEIAVPNNCKQAFSYRQKVHGKG